MSRLLELLGRGLEGDLGDVLDRYYWSPPAEPVDELAERCHDHPDWPDMQLRLALTYLRASRVEDAIDHLRQACRRKPDYLAARVALAAAHAEKGSPQAALDQLKIAGQIAPAGAPVLFAMGFCCEKLGRAADAAEYYRDATIRDGAFRPARERLAAVAVFLDRVEEAVEQYEALLRAHPEEPWIRSAVAHLHCRAGRHDDAIREFETAISMEPENWALLDDEVESLVAEGHLREAIERLHTLIERQGSFADLHLRLGDLYGRTGDDEAAMSQYRRALELQPTYLEATVRMGTQHLISGRWEEAAEAFQTACELSDRVLENYVGLGVAQLAAGDEAAAMNSFDLAHAVEPNSTILLAEMAKLQLKAAVAEEYARSFETGGGAPTAELDLDNDHLLERQIDRHAQAVEREPRHADVRYRYGVMLRAEGRLGEALEQFEQAVEINPTYVKAIIKLAVTQQDLGMTEEAIETFRRALELRPEFVDLHYRLGLLYTERQNFERAVEHLQTAVAGATDNEQCRAFLALAFQNMGLMDRAAATWRSLWRVHEAAT